MRSSLPTAPLFRQSSRQSSRQSVLDDRVDEGSYAKSEHTRRSEFTRRSEYTSTSRQSSSSKLKDHLFSMSPCMLMPRASMGQMHLTSSRGMINLRISAIDGKSAYDRYDECFGGNNEEDDEDEDDEYDEYDEYFDEEEETVFPSLHSNSTMKTMLLVKLIYQSLLIALTMMIVCHLPTEMRERYGPGLILPKRNEVKEEKPAMRRKLGPSKCYLATASQRSIDTHLPKEKPLATLSPQHTSLSHINKDAEHLFLPKYQFGGLTGGLKEGIQRRVDVAEASMDPSYRSALPGMVPILRNSNSNNAGLGTRVKDPFNGFGPPQFHPALSTRSISHDGHVPEKVTLTSTPLTGYNPPADDGPAIVLDPMLHGALMDVSYLPYNPDLEIPVFWDVPMTEDLEYNMCSATVSGFGQGAIDRQSKESTSERDLPLKAEFIHSSTYANVDCSTSSGIDRGIAQDLATSNLMSFILQILWMRHVYSYSPAEAYGRGIVLMRDPVDRVVALYEYLNAAKQGDGRGVNKLSLEQFAKSDLTEDNPLTRSLSSNKSSKLNKADIQVAKEILKRKFVVCMTNYKIPLTASESSLGGKLQKRHANVNLPSWSESSAQYNQYLNRKHPGLTPAALDAIKSKNEYDLELFEYGKFMFKHQGVALFDTAVEIQDKS
ncbi:LOW QUALITY PROTEIN: hypothetical protein ACHAWO_002120 [Cyclotella atomus]|uniref:Sulfotransferase n=1 Tax=Cyclotella atomus TaxID=382360 RepID=A0ABD3NN40_9STRA